MMNLNQLSNSAVETSWWINDSLVCQIVGKLLHAGKSGRKIAFAVNKILSDVPGAKYHGKAMSVGAIEGAATRAHAKSPGTAKRLRRQVLAEKLLAKGVKADPSEAEALRTRAQGIIQQLDDLDHVTLRIHKHYKRDPQQATTREIADNLAETIRKTGNQLVSLHNDTDRTQAQAEKILENIRAERVMLPADGIPGVSIQYFSRSTKTGEDAMSSLRRFSTVTITIPPSLQRGYSSVIHAYVLASALASLIDSGNAPTRSADPCANIDFIDVRVQVGNGIIPIARHVRSENPVLAK